ncbi:GspE/PulE family protein [Vibrio cholerae]|uniref:GspE/PulE family protein n=1 Tax=Vibrio cholerae TaxID=666 RepID=UPI003702BB49|nr:exonuclease SbcC [Vibrio cholerae]EGR0574568.1 exonuclease SbcC [Vibrio cholerae]
MSDVLQTEGLKTIYLRHQDAVLLDNGEIHTSDLDSQSIPEIIKEYKEHRNLIPELNGRRPKVVKKSVSEVAAYIDKTISNKNNFAFVDKAKISKIAEAARDILQKSAMLGVSDIHFEIYRDRTEINVRVDGRITPLQKQIPEKEFGMLICGYMFNEATQKKHDFSENKANDGRLEIELNTPDGNRLCKWRLAYIYADGGGQLTLRWLNKDPNIPEITDLGWEQGHYDTFIDFTESSNGVCLISGQTGSGKSTTLAAALNSMKGKGRAINTIEEPVEFDIGVIQTSISNTADSDTFVDVAKYLLRHDPDVEMHGEVREEKGAMSVCRKGETGQLMFATLHTSSCIGIAHTLSEQMGVPVSLISAPNLMRLWIYQALVRKVCPKCSLTKEEALNVLSPRDKGRLEIWMETQKGKNLDNVRFKNPEGCSHCIKGEKGRTSVIEMLVLDDEDRRYILNKDYLGWAQALKAKGFKDIISHANLKILRGEIDVFTASERVLGLMPQETRDIYNSFF